MILVLPAPPQVGAVRSAHRDAVGVDEHAVDAVEVLIALSAASWRTRVLSRDQRSASTACLNGPSARVPERVPSAQHRR
jgi:hypothetical protein